VNPWTRWAAERNAAIAGEGRWRTYRSFDGLGQAGGLHDGHPGTGPDGRPVVSFAGNDYLGLTAHPQVIAAAHDALDRWGTGSGASRLVTGSRPVHHDLEQSLADWKGCERAVLFPTGYAANLGVLSALAAAGSLICSDELNHASIVDGARLARGEVAVFPHGDLDALDRLLLEASAVSRPTIIVSDTVFSMDGDLAPVASLAELGRRHGSLLVLDEAHAVLGPHPDPAELDGVDVVRVGTLSKTLGSLGGFAATSGPLADLLVNTARPSIFTTALTPADAAAALAALGILRSAEGDELVARLQAHVQLVRPGHPSPIVPVVLGDELHALSASASLLEQGLLVPAIRPPTVAPGSSRLRVTLSAAHTSDQVDELVSALAAIDVARVAPVHGARP
jgi:8-amino-7-oxononanoate synthase